MEKDFFADECDCLSRVCVCVCVCVCACVRGECKRPGGFALASRSPYRFERKTLYKFEKEATATAAGGSAGEAKGWLRSTSAKGGRDSTKGYMKS